MKGTEFIERFGNKGLPAWEAAALQLAKEDGLVRWPMIPIHLEIPGHTATLEVASDYLAAGDPTDYVYLPMGPRTAQSIANLTGRLLPTPKLVYEIWKQSPTKLTPIKYPDLTPAKYEVLEKAYNKENMGENPAQMVAHDRAVQLAMQLSKVAPPYLPDARGITSGHKKDVVMSNIYQPNKVLIYGWFQPDTSLPVKEQYPPTAKTQPIQARSNFHYGSYADYSHGIREISPVMTVDGKTMMTEEVMRDPVLSKLVSDEGPLSRVRYDAPNAPAPYRPVHQTELPAAVGVYYRAPNKPDLATLGAIVLAEHAQKTRTQ